jgi:hypothetical protein
MATFANLTINDTGYLTLPQGGDGSRPGGTGVDVFNNLGTSTWICPQGVTSVEYLVVGGGGGGGSGAVSANNGGGGGAGGLLTGNVTVVPGTQYTVVVGAGGAPDNQGGFSQFSATAGFAFIAFGGGAGGGLNPAVVGGNGGSGGGGGPAVPRTAGTGTAGQGNNGGAGNPNSPFQGGGGGGAGGVGGSPNGNGGAGLSYSITGTLVTYAGGGGGGADSSAGTGSAGGGNGGLPGSRAPTQGTDGLGSGGGGGASQNPTPLTFNSITGARGGHGIVVLKYTNPTITPVQGMLRYNTTIDVPEFYTGTAWKSIKNVYDGSTAARAAPSAEYIKATTGTNTDGLYWINLPTVGAQQVYCLMNSSANGGGWMMAMKATRGTTFNYSSSYWTAINTLNTGNANRNDGDAKFDVFNYHSARDIMALWPDIGTNGGGLGSNPYSCWSWLQNSFYEGNPMTLVNFFNTAGWYNTGNNSTGSNYGGHFRGLAKSSANWASGIFSSQNAINFYGFNFKNPQNYNTRAYVRWGFGWNENGEGNYTSPATLATGGAPGSDDVSGGIGMDSSFGNYSAGDQINCCQDSTGINRSARVEVYVR